MPQTIKIVRMDQGQVNTRRGPKSVIRFTDDKNQDYSAFVSDWNAHWQPGMDVVVEVEEKWVNGKLYRNARQPRNTNSNQNNDLVMNNDQAITLLREIRDHLKTLVHAQTTPSYGTAKEQPQNDQPPPPGDTDIPF